MACRRDLIFHFPTSRTRPPAIVNTCVSMTPLVMSRARYLSVPPAAPSARPPYLRGRRGFRRPECWQLLGPMSWHGWTSPNLRRCSHHRHWWWVPRTRYQMAPSAGARREVVEHHLEMSVARCGKCPRPLPPTSLDLRVSATASPRRVKVLSPHLTITPPRAVAGSPVFS